MDKLIIALDSQRLGVLQSCGLKYNLRFNTNLDLAENSDGIKKGSFTHELLRYYYMGKGALFLDEGGEPIGPLDSYKARDKAVPLARKKIPEIGIGEDEIIEVISTFHEYVDAHSNESWKILGVERPFSLILYEDDEPFTLAGVEYSGLIILWEGIIDLEVSNGRESFPVDHKTSGRRDYPEELVNQFLGYAYAYPYPTKTKMVAVNQIIFKKDKDKFFRPFLNYTNDMLDAFVISVVTAVKKDYFYYLNINTWPPNFHSCNQKFKCGFHDLCKEDKATRAFLIKSKYKIVEPWDPFKRD